MAPDVLRHRILLSYDAIAQNVTPDHVVETLRARVLAPRVSPSQDAVAV